MVESVVAVGVAVTSGMLDGEDAIDSGADGTSWGEPDSGFFSAVTGANAESVARD